MTRSLSLARLILVIALLTVSTGARAVDPPATVQEARKLLGISREVAAA